jgi:hypothetical protein
VLAVGFAGVEGRDDMGMKQFGRRFDFAMEALDAVGRLGGRCRQDLERYDAFHAAVLGLVDLAHAAGSDLVEHHVFAEDQCPGFALAGELGLEFGELA